MNYRTFTLLLCCCLVQSALAQDKPKNLQYGEINIEDTQEKAKDAFQDTQDTAIEKLKDAATRVPTLASGGSASPIPQLDDNTLGYLGAVYLYCTANNGVCPLVLDGLLEIEVVNARLSKETTCPNLKKFWEVWEKNDMENRQKFMVKLGFSKTTSDFNTIERPKYVACLETVKTETQGPGSDAEFFKTRYATGSKNSTAIPKLARFTELVKQKVPNVFAAVGIDYSSPKGGSTGGGEGKSRPAPPPAVKRSR